MEVNSQQSFPFEQLPHEIQTTILSYALVHRYDLVLHRSIAPRKLHPLTCARHDRAHCKHCPRPSTTASRRISCPRRCSQTSPNHDHCNLQHALPGLFAISRSLRATAKPLYLAENVFSTFATAEKCRTRMRRLPTESVRGIRRLKVYTLRIDKHPDFRDWRLFLRELGQTADAPRLRVLMFVWNGSFQQRTRLPGRLRRLHAFAKMVRAEGIGARFQGLDLVFVEVETSTMRFYAEWDRWIEPAKCRMVLRFGDMGWCCYWLAGVNWRLDSTERFVYGMVGPSSPETDDGRPEASRKSFSWNSTAIPSWTVIQHSK